MADIKEQRKDNEIVQLLLKHGADVNAKSNNSSTPLHLATSPDIVRLLLQYNADTDARDQSFRTPLHLTLQSWVSDKLHDS